MIRDGLIADAVIVPIVRIVMSEGRNSGQKKRLAEATTEDFAKIVGG